MVAPAGALVPSRRRGRLHVARCAAVSVNQSHLQCSSRYAKRMTVRDMLTALQTLPRDAELLAFEAGCEDYGEREVDEVQWQGDRVYLHLGVRRDDPPRR